jgi:quinol monooxygenase YgiN
LIAVAWQFEVKPEYQEAFEHFFGADGEWTAFSRRSRAFLGSSFLKDLAQPSRYLLVEYWSETLVYEKHLADYSDEVKSLESQRERFLTAAHPLGIFNALDVPDRSGPTWSRRTGRTFQET